MDRPPPLRLLTVFATVARRGSMRAAAEELNVSQSAISQSLRALEDHIGAPLFDRSMKPPPLTSAGRKLETAAANGLQLIEDAVAAIRSEARSGESAVTVACTHGLATYWLMPRLSGFYSAHPDILVNVQANPSDLPAPPAGVDATFFYGEGRPLPGRMLHIFDEEARPVGRRDVIERLIRDGRTWRDAPLIHVEAPSSDRWPGWNEYAARLGQPPPSARGLRFNTYVQGVQAALGGHGLLLGWRCITEDLIASGELTALPDQVVSFGTAYYLVVPSGGDAKPSTRIFADWAASLAAGKVRGGAGTVTGATEA